MRAGTTKTLRIPPAPLGQLIRAELEARGWTTADLARSIASPEWNAFVLDLAISSTNPDLVLDEKAAIALARGLGVSPEFLLDLDRAYRTRGN